MLKTLFDRPEKSAGEYFVWSVEDRHVSVHLNLSTVNLFDALAREVLATLPFPGIETGGLLLGRVRNPNPGQYIVSIERFEPFEIDKVRGSRYIIRGDDRDELFERLRKFEKTNKGLSVVGFYRSHLRPGLYLDEYDFDLMKSYFAHPSCVAMLFRPVHDSPATAGFFFWEDGEIHRARTYREFPLRAELLRQRQPVERPDASAPMVSPLPVTPDASAGALRNPFFAWTAIAVAALIAAAALWQPGNPLRKRAHNVLSLNAELSQSGLRLTWDRTNPLIAQNGSATLSITDGTEEKQVVLDATQLKTGALVYWPTSSDVNFRLQLGGFTESLRAISPRLPAKPAVDIPVAVEQPAVQAPPPKTLLASVPAPRLEPPPVRPAALPEDRESPKIKPQPPSRPIITERNISRPPTVTDIEPVRASGFKNAVSSIPGLLVGKRRDRSVFVPAKAVRQVNPNLPGSVKLPADISVSVKVSLDESGQVRGTDLVTRDVDTRLANAAMDAARRWRFKPAREQSRPVSSAVILHFRFNREGDGS